MRSDARGMKVNVAAIFDIERGGKNEHAPVGVTDKELIVFFRIAKKRRNVDVDAIKRNWR